MCYGFLTLNSPDHLLLGRVGSLVIVNYRLKYNFAYVSKALNSAKGPLIFNGDPDPGPGHEHFFKIYWCWTKEEFPNYFSSFFAYFYAKTWWTMQKKGNFW